MAFTYDLEVVVQVPAAKFFKAFALDYDNIVPKVVPQYFKSVQVIEGDGGVGSIKYITFGEASEFKYAKGEFQALDEANLTITYTIFEGDGLEGKYEKVTNEISFEASSDGGCIYKSHTTHYPVAGYEIKEDEVKAGNEKAKGLVKAIEAYLVANPDAYN